MGLRSSKSHSRCPSDCRFGCAFDGPTRSVPPGNITPPKSDSGIANSGTTTPCVVDACTGSIAPVYVSDYDDHIADCPVPRASPNYLLKHLDANSVSNVEINFARIKLLYDHPINRHRLRDFIESEFDNAGITMLNNPCTKHCFDRAICGQAYDFDRPLEPQRDLNYGDDLWEKELCAKNYLLRRMLLAEMDGDLLAVLMMGAVQRFLESSVELREREVEECITHTPKYDDSSVRRTTKSPFISRGYRSKSVDSLANHGRTTPETSKKSFIKAYSFSSRKRFSRSSRVGVGADTNSLDESQRSSASNSMMSVSSNCSGATQSRTSDPSIPRVVEELAKCAMRGTHKHVLSSKSWLRLLILSLEPAPVAVYIVSASKVAQTRINYPIVFANKTFERISQYRRREVLGRHYSILHGEATNPAKVKLVDDAYRHGKEASVCYTNYTKHGRAFENMLSVKPLFDQQGRHRYSVCVVYNASNPGSSLSRFFLGREVIRYCPSKIVEY